MQRNMETAAAEDAVEGVLADAVEAANRDGNRDRNATEGNAGSVGAGNGAEVTERSGNHNGWGYASRNHNGSDGRNSDESNSGDSETGSAGKHKWKLFPKVIENSFQYAKTKVNF
jgi:hypothetical protein